MVEKLDTLIDYLDRLQGKASLTGLTNLLETLELDAEDVGSFLHFAEPSLSAAILIAPAAGIIFGCCVGRTANARRSTIMSVPVVPCAYSGHGHGHGFRLCPQWTR